MSNRILLALDARADATLLRATLADAGFDVAVARDGVGAVQAYYRDRHDLVILDRLMPQLNGDLAGLLLRDDPENRGLPILIISAAEERSSEFRGMTTGADHYLPKHHGRAELLERVGSMLAARPVADTPRPVPRELSAIDVLSKLGRVLDRKLFLSTIQRDLYEIGRQVRELRRSLLSVFGLLGRVADFDIAMLELPGRPILLYCATTTGASLVRALLALYGLEQTPVETLTSDSVVLGPGRERVREVHSLNLGGSGGQAMILTLASATNGMMSDALRASLRGMAPGIALVVDNARLVDALATHQRQMDSELEMARQVQLAMLPTTPLPRAIGLDLAACLVQARHVGGDYYHYAAHGDRAWIAIADVAGKGMAAALIASAVNAMVTQLLPTAQGTSSVLHALNAHCYEHFRKGKRFVSLSLLVWDPAERVLEIAGAGHEHVLLMREGAPSCEQIPVGGMVLGIRPSNGARVGARIHLELACGDTVLLYSDGATEATSPGGARFGIERLAKLFEQLAGSPLEAMVDKIRGRIEAFGVAGAPADDLTLVAFRVQPDIRLPSGVERRRDAVLADVSASRSEADPETLGRVA